LADATKIQGQLLDWTALPDTVTDSPSLDSGDLNVGAGYVDVLLSITVAHIDVNVAGANYVTVKVLVKTGATDETWRLLTAFQTGGGTAVLEAVAASSASAQNRVEVADTTDWDTGLGERLFLMDATLVDSEIIEILGWVDNDAFLCIDNLTNTHADTADILDGLNEHQVSIPNGFQYVKVVFHNADDDANYAVRVDYSAVTEFV
jgi:hypothetical protein